MDHSTKGGIAPRIVRLRTETKNIYKTLSGKSEAKGLLGTHKYIIELNL